MIVHTEYVGDATITLAIIGSDNEYRWKDNVTYSIRLPYVSGSESACESGRTFVGSDLTVVRQASVSDTLGDAYESLCSFLSAAGESYGRAMRSGTPLSETENGDLFPADVTEWAYQNDDALSMVGIFADERADAEYWDGIATSNRESGACDR